MNTTYSLTSPQLVLDGALPFLARAATVANGTNQWLYLPSAAVYVAPYTLQVVALPGDTVARIRQIAPSGRNQAGTNGDETVTVSYDSADIPATAATPLAKPATGPNEQSTSATQPVPWVMGALSLVTLWFSYFIPSTFVDRIELSYASSAVPEVVVTLCQSVHPGNIPNQPNLTLTLAAGETVTRTAAFLYQAGDTGALYAVTQPSGPSRVFTGSGAAPAAGMLNATAHWSSVITS